LGAGGASNSIGGVELLLGLTGLECASEKQDTGYRQEAYEGACESQHVDTLSNSCRAVHGRTVKNTLLHVL